MSTTKHISLVFAVIFLSAPVFGVNQYVIQQLPPEPAQLGSGDVVGFEIEGMNGGQAVGAVSFQSDGLASPVLTLPFIYDGTSYGALPLNSAVGDSAQPVAVNNGGVIVGNGWSSADPFNQIPVEWENGILAQPSLGAYSAGSATSVNNLGQIAGYVSGVNGQNASSAAWWDQNGVLHDLGKFGADAAVVTGINDNGQMLIEALSNNSPNQILLWDHGVATPITGATGGAVALNNAGHALLSGESAGFPAFSFWNGTTFTQLPELPGDLAALYFSMNDQDQIVGMSTSFDLSRGPDTAVLWEAGVLYNLNSLLPANSGWDLTRADAINNDGDILAEGSSGQFSGYVLLVPDGANGFSVTSAPEAGTIGVLGIGVVGLMRRRRRVTK